MAEIKQFKPSTKETSKDKRKVIEKLHNLTDDLEKKLKK